MPLHCPEMYQAFTYAQRAKLIGEVPVGAIITHKNKIIAQAHNLIESNKDPTAHAEILCIQQACHKLQEKFLDQCFLYVTLEPCTMCAMAIAHARIEKVYFGAYDPKSGGIEQGSCVFDHPQCHHKPQVIGGIMEKECSNLLQEFFKQKRMP